MIISGGANIYPIDLETVLAQHPAVREAAVVAGLSELWGETPGAFVVLEPDRRLGGDDLLVWANQRLGKFQRVSELRLVPSLPRSAIGKVLKCELQAQL
jgi:acyl-CoA synthetase (AMP-forming)/AMP-acid ligase II